MSEFIFEREDERQAIRQRLAKQRSFLLHGPAGVGKSLLLRSLLPEFPSVLYCENSATTHAVFRSLAYSLLRLRNSRAQVAFRNEEGIKTKSAVSLKGVVMEALNEGQYSIVLDHLKQPSHAFAAAVREMMGWGSTAVCALSRSSHMEDTGFLQPIYADRSERYEIREFDSSTARRFACEVITRRGLTASNLSEFLDKIVEFSGGNPGAILGLVERAMHLKYRSDERIKITPLYIDFRMNWNAPGTR
jgi:AAA ATPase domain